MILALRLLMTPLLIAAATLIGRRWGPGVSGWLIGFPLTSAPVSIILVLQYGSDFAAQAAVGAVCARQDSYDMPQRAADRGGESFYTDNID